MAKTRTHGRDALLVSPGRRQERPPIPGRERLVTALAAALIVFLGWSLGSMRPWAQVTLGVMSAVIFVVAMAPGKRGKESGGRSQVSGVRDQVSGVRGQGAEAGPWGRLGRFPIFWLGGLYVGYLLCQALNPAWMYVREGTRWWLQKIPHVEWLPHGMMTPWDQMSPWRCLVWMGGAWLLVCGLHVALRHRRSAVFLLWVAVLSATAMSFVGILQRMTGTGKFLWSIDGLIRNYSFGMFIYKNHAGAFLLLNFGLTLGLALQSWIQGRQMGKASNPGFFLLCCAMVQGAGLILSQSRMAVVLACVLLAVFGVAAILLVFREGGVSRVGMAGAVAALVLLTLGGGLLAGKADLERLNQRLQVAVQDLFNLAEGGEAEAETKVQDGSLQARIFIARATLDMWQEEPFFGFGIGSYRFYIPVHQRNYREIWEHPLTRNPRYLKSRGLPPGAVMNWRLTYAHSDWLQSLAEAGVVGTLLLVMVLAGWVWVLGSKAIAWTEPTVVWLAGWGLLFFYAAGEFVFWCPSILFGFALVPVLTAKTLR